MKKTQGFRSDKEQDEKREKEVYRESEVENEFEGKLAELLEEEVAEYDEARTR